MTSATANRQVKSCYELHTRLLRVYGVVQGAS